MTQTRSGLAFVCLALLAGTPSRAADTWSTPHPGVRLLYRTTSKPLRIHALVVDLCRAGIDVRATASSERKQTVPSFASAVGAVAAVNGDFFSYATYATGGLGMGSGKKWPDTVDGNGEGLIAFGPERVRIDPPSLKLTTLPPWMREVVGGKPKIVVDGKAATGFTNDLCTARHPRTAAGVSRDRRSLFLVVVDGRSSVSIGMTCSELGALLEDLGAHEALNLDGGGSSTLWVKGKGVVNDPSDGTPRVVANHLAIKAAGKGTPPICDPTVDELALAADAVSASLSTDLDGDGKADLCALAGSELHCHLASGTGFGGAIVAKLPAGTDWSKPGHYATLRAGDLDGDGKADLCLRATSGITCFRSTGTALAPALAGPPLSDAAGYGALSRFSTIRLADVNGDGKADLCVRAAADFRCYPSTGSGFGAALVGPALPAADGWEEVEQYGTIRMGDVNGDGKDDLCARAASGMKCWLSDGSSFPKAIAGPAWTNAAGFGEVSSWSTIRLVDVNGDHRADLCARTATDFRCHLSKGSSFAAASVGPALSDAAGWWRYDNYSTIRLADLDDDGDLDLCARSDKGIVCWPWTGQGFGASLGGPGLADTNGWADPPNFRTLRLADVTGDGKADLCARAGAGVQCWPSTGAAFGAALAGPAWSDAAGWAEPERYGSIRLAGRRCVPRPELCDGKDNDCDGLVDEDAGCAPPPDLGPDDPRDAGVPPDAALEPDGSPGSDGAWSWDEQAEPAPEPGGCACRVGAGPGLEGVLALAFLFLLRGGRRRR